MGEREMPNVCGIMHGGDAVGLVDAEGCVLAAGHDGPHEFKDQHGRRWLWETDLECDCEHCMLCEGDYCTIYWPKPITRAAASLTPAPEGEQHG